MNQQDTYMDLAIAYQDYDLGHIEDHESNSLIQLSSSLASVFPEKGNFSPGFLGLPEMPLQPSISSEVEFLCDVNKEKACHGKRKVHDIQEEDAQSKGVIMEQQSDQLKRTRSAEIHNISERRRRDRIKGKVKILQGLMPHCKKKDRASILEDAAEYIKALKLQVEKLGGSECLAGYTGNPSIQIPGIAPFVPMRPVVGICMGCCGQCAQLVQFPSGGFHFPTMPSTAVENSSGERDPYYEPSGSRASYCGLEGGGL